MALSNLNTTIRMPRRGISFFKDISVRGKLIGAYRLSSVLLTGAAYIVFQPGSLWPYKILVVSALFITAGLLNAFYVAHENDRTGLLLALAVETIGISLLLIPTGGVNSPFLWYALNPALVAACVFPWWVCWGDFAFFIGLDAVVTAFVHQQMSLEFAQYAQFGTTFLVLALAVLALQLTARLANQKEAETARLQVRKEELDAINYQLTTVNEHLNSTIDNLMALYQTVISLASETSEKSAADLFPYYAAKLSGAKIAFYRSVIPEGAKAVICNMDGIDLSAIQGCSVDASGPIITVKASGVDFLVSPVKSSAGLGLLGISIDVDGLREDPLFTGRLEFLCSLYTMVLDRQGARDMEERLTISQEQNRIAGEIHDSVCQRLFSIACSVHNIAANLPNLEYDTAQEQLKLVEGCAGAANKELRSCIYSLNNCKKNGVTLFTELESYLKEFARLNGITVNMEFSGADTLSLDRKKAVHRFVREACGNAARHGKCTKLDVSIQLDGQGVLLNISDDGIGFTTTQAHPSAGMGMENMRIAVQQRGGRLTVESQQDYGTSITIVLPTLCNYGRLEA